METFTDIFKNYKKYSAEALKEASIMQAISSAGMFLAGQKNINDLKVDRPNNLSTDTLSLNSYDMSRGALNNLDKSFNTMLRFSRESGKDANPLLMSEYSRSATDIAAKQAALNNDIHNKEAIANFEASNKTKAINTQIEANYLRAKDKLDMAKAGMRINNLGQLTKGIANIENMKMAREDALGKMGTEAKYLDKSLGLHNRSVFNGDEFINTGKIEVPKLSFGELQKGFNINAKSNESNTSIEDNNTSQSSTNKSNIDFGGLNHQQGFDVSKFTPKLKPFNFKDLPPYSGVKMPKDVSVYSTTKPFGGYGEQPSSNLQSFSNKNIEKQQPDTTHATRQKEYAPRTKEEDASMEEKQNKFAISVMNYDIAHPNGVALDQPLSTVMKMMLPEYKKYGMSEEDAKKLITQKYNEGNYSRKAKRAEKQNVKKNIQHNSNSEKERLGPFKGEKDTDPEFIKAGKKLGSTNINKNYNEEGDKEVTEQKRLVSDKEYDNQTTQVSNKNLNMPIKGGNIIEHFGIHDKVIDNGDTLKINNNGINISVGEDKNIYSMTDGVVTNVSSIKPSDNVVMIRSGDYIVVYSNIKNKKSLPKVGDKITKDDVIGDITGKDKLHIEIWYNYKKNGKSYLKKMNPEQFIKTKK